MRSPFVVVVRSGPVFELDTFQFLAETLGQKFEGVVWTHGREPECRDVGSFHVRRDAVDLWTFPRLKKAWRLVALVGRGLGLRWLEGRRLVVITYDPLANGLVGVGLKYLAGARFICEVNGVYADPLNFADMMAHNPREAERKRRSMVRVGSWVLRRADHIKLLFSDQLSDFERIPPDIPRSVFVNLVDATRFRRTDGEQGRLLLFVGYPFFRKGVDVLLEAWGRVCVDFPEWTLALIGHRLEEGARQMELPTEQVEFLGTRSQGEVSEWLGRASALMLPSRSEAMGRVLIEAAFRGRARIGSRVGGISTYIKDGEDGLLFTSEDAEDLARVLREFLSDAGAPERMGRAARQRAEDEFSAARYLSNYEPLILGP